MTPLDLAEKIASEVTSAHEKGDVKSLLMTELSYREQVSILCCTQGTKLRWSDDYSSGFHHGWFGTVINNDPLQALYVYPTEVANFERGYQFGQAVKRAYLDLITKLAVS